MSLPKVSPTHSQERIGVNVVAESLARMNLVWRETPMADVGIDGQVEFVNDADEATGQLVAVQVKSGPSYLREGPDNNWIYYPSGSHRSYWEQFPIPVLLFLCDPDTRTVFWVDARQFLRSPSNDGKVGILVPKEQTLAVAQRGALFSNVGETGGHFLDLDQLVETLMNRRIHKAEFSVSFFDIFAMGLTNVAKTLYFDMGLVSTIAEARTEIVTLTREEYQFVYDYMLFVVGQQIADVPWSDCMVDWHDRQMVPSWMARLTRRGRELVKHIQGMEKRLRESKVITTHAMHHVMQETFVAMQWTPETWARIDLCRMFQDAHQAALLLPTTTVSAAVSEPNGEPVE